MQTFLMEIIDSYENTCENLKHHLKYGFLCASFIQIKSKLTKDNLTRQIGMEIKKCCFCDKDEMIQRISICLLLILFG
jgi:hypothetical protein